MRTWLLACVFVAASICVSSALAGETVGGWRGNGTGLWKQGKAPLEWHRLPQGALQGLRSQTDRPADDKPGDAPLAEKGQIRQWLVLGPFPVPNAVTDFDQDALDGEATVEPKLGDKQSGHEWQPAKVAPDDPDVFGEAGVPWLDLAKAVGGFKQNQFAYAHAYLYSPAGGPARIVADHSWGLKAWINGKVVFRNPERKVVLGGYPHLSRLELEHSTDSSSKFDIELKAGWNRFLLKISAPGPNGHAEMVCNLRVVDAPDVKYDSQNIAWMTELTGRTTSTPIIVGDRLFTMAEPDELICLDKRTGKVLWSEFVNHYQTVTATERAANPAFAQRVDPLVAALKAERDPIARIKLRAQIEAALEDIDRPRFKLPRSGHFDAHFGIVGYTMPTPISDGKRIYVWSGQGIAACYDFDGKRQWITPVTAGELNYASTPALSDGVFVVFLNRLFGISAATGEIVWDQPRVKKNVAGLLSATLAGQPVVVTQEGEVVRPRDGHLLYRPRGMASNDTGWTPGVVLGDVLYQPKYGIKHLSILDFAGQSGETWQPKVIAAMETPDELNHRPDGGWLDRSTACSPLVVGKYAYLIDMYSELCVYDLEAKQVVHHRKLELHGFTHYNALAVAASPTLIGDHLVIMDNQGTALVLTLGPDPKLVHRNLIATQLDRRVPIPAQEILSYAPPIVDSDHIYLRGERYLYCIGAK
jgi:hypothetical protein